MTGSIENYFYHGFYIFLMITVITCSVIATKLMTSGFNSRSISLFNLYFYLGMAGFSWLWIQNIFELTPDFRSGVAMYVLSIMLLQLAIFNYDEKSRFNLQVIAFSLVCAVFIFFMKTINQLAIAQLSYTFITLPVLIYVSFKRAILKSNIGNGVLAIALCILLIIAISQLAIVVSGNLTVAVLYSLTVVGHATVFVMIGLGLITTLLIDEKKRYLDLSLKDPLTNLYNRRGLQFILEQQRLLTSKHNSKLYASVVDIDYFKRINDSYGHEGGDLVLEVFSELLNHHLAKQDLCCRLGGEEFLILSFEPSENAAQQKLETLRTIVETSEIVFHENNITLTASFGLTRWQQDDTFDNLINRADKALYSAKNKGRNRVEINL
ncbi:GGDEF domain-containing protein [Pseudoalteromonas lipolytica]|jgi:diguanylate cyclase (GGDEF)-like protein|uniref:diguanylate cyclase n=1 Tax=Pseudoalteromonas lipolytica TaxID=570156 RepID=A0AAD0S0J5_9GAMM|nr:MULTISPECIES: GGDEF domain-containing protein [Pseudoalteromonas]AXV65883.1 GGDEF domain-containing protein [Pseudoalteromonas donghaensis]EWH07670.1 diguanylate cyclase [Pseudoalteromonas lipolytica SCSIO 04301]QLJ07431.1 GGDEF domain-containing protein [Pseudoalteromonas sp. JSTW]